MLLVEASLDTVAPPDKMLRPLADKLEKSGGSITYRSIKSGHSFVGQRMKLARVVGEWIEDVITSDYYR